MRIPGIDYDPIIGAATRPLAEFAYGRRGMSPRPDCDHSWWQGEYARRLEAASGEPYRESEVRAFGLFEATDAGNNVIQFARRLTRDIAFVCEKDAQGLSGPLSLEVVPSVRAAGGDEAVVIYQDIGELIWARSRIKRFWSSWVKTAAVQGDLFMEAVRNKDGTARIVWYRPASVEVTYDETGTEIVQALITVALYEGPTVDTATGVPTAGATRDRTAGLYIRRVTATRIDVWRDGVFSASESGEHFLGVCPVVHAPWLPWVEPCHGQWAASGLDAPLAQVDSALSQMQAIGTRHANPILLGEGVRVNGPDVFKPGRTISVQAGAKVSYLEANLQGIVSITEAAQQHLDNVRATLPHFALFSAGAGASGDALAMHATDYVTRINDIRGRVFDALATVTSYAWLLERGDRYQPERMIYAVAAPPPLPVDVGAEVNRLLALREKGAITVETFTARLQSLGIIPAEQSPVEYATKVATEQAELDAAAMDRMASLRVSGAVIADETDPERVAQDLDAIAQAIAEGDTAAALEELAALREVMGRGRGGSDERR